MKETENERLIREGRERIRKKEEELARQKRLSEIAERRKERVTEELQLELSKGNNFAEVIDSLGVSLSEVISHTVRRIAGRQ